MRRFLLGAVSAVLFQSIIPAQMTFKNVELRTAYGAADQGDGGRLVVDGERIRFLKGDNREQFSIPAKAVTEIFYSRVAGRRIKTAILVSPLLLFTKGKKHYMTLSFNDGASQVGAVEFKLDKKNYRGVLRAVEEVSGVTMAYDQEGVKADKETVASRSSDSPAAAASSSSEGTLEFASSPDGAEIELDGAFIGSTPRSKSVKPGEYRVVMKKKGFKDWERKVAVSAGENLKVVGEMEEN
jgi:PEGA domain